MEAIQIFEYEGQQIEFNLGTNLMINATDMAKIYRTDLGQFLRNDGTKKFINECLNTANSQYLNTQKESDLYMSKQKSGTWMHRVLALKFAAWLDPNFELWVFCTIDRIMFGSLREDVKIKTQVREEKEKALEKLMTNPDYLKLLEIESKEKELKGKITKQQKVQLNLFC